MKLILKILAAPVIAVLVIFIAAETVRLGIRYCEHHPRCSRPCSSDPRQCDQRNYHLSVCLPRKSHGIADGSCLDDWANAEIPLFRAGCDLRITNFYADCREVEFETGMASAVPVFYIGGGERLSQQHALFPCTLPRGKPLLSPFQTEQTTD